MKEQANYKGCNQSQMSNEKQNVSSIKQNTHHTYFDTSTQSPSPNQQIKIDTKNPGNIKFSTQPNTSTNSPRIDNYYEKLMNKRKMFNFHPKEPEDG